MSVSAPWPFRALWLVLPLLSGPAVGEALSDRSRAVQVTVSVLAWGLWALVLVAAAVPRASTLTVVRVLAPAAPALALVTAFDADTAAWAAVGLGTSVAAAFLALAPATSDAFVDGSSYGTERRVALRTPAPLVLGPVPLAWLVGAAGVVSGPLLLAAEQWVAGGVAAVVGFPVAAAVVYRLHVLSRRWLVFVPAGVVVHDPLSLAEPVLLQRHLVRRLGPAPADAADDPGALDLSGGAFGLALEVRSVEPFSVGLRRGRDTVETPDVEALLVSPGRPATTLEVAAGHRLPVA